MRGPVKEFRQHNVRPYRLLNIAIVLCVLTILAAAPMVSANNWQLGGRSVIRSWRDLRGKGFPAGARFCLHRLVRCGHRFHRFRWVVAYCRGNYP